ncbi:GreA/GreB family elongation factor [Zhongshania guokunii]|uniref:GreA/GreB family elongation factor n=1 Tax=Zhongshania guokunii TaxID=641783 RepID=A0ABV3U6H8_9GAMM
MNTVDDAYLLIKESDYLSLTEFIKRNRSEATAALAEEINKAKVIADDGFPDNVVSLNATVDFYDPELSKASKVTLVLPWQADLTKRKVSILSPVGCALIGLRTGGRVDWPLLNGKARKLDITAVSQQQKLKRRALA